MSARAEGAGRGRRRPDLDTVYTINPDGSRNFLHPADVRGRWQRRKNLIWAVLILVYAGLPWLTVGGRPAVHFDIPGRAAHLFGRSFTNQDFYLVFFLLTGAGFGLIVLAALWGRVWCGYGCPQTVFMEGVFRRVERWVEGPRVERIRRNLGPPTLDRFWRKTVKHAAFLALCAVVAHAFTAYFIPARELLAALGRGPAGHTTAFVWTVAWTAALYFNYSWFREQTCLIICPYGRLQSTLVDDDTVNVGYDQRRGEPRHKGVGAGGDCIDCFRCVEVCPTGIDIRNGLQMECIGCANCVDACDEVMARTGRPPGLVRYDSPRGFETGARRFWRPRVAIYAALGLLGLGVAGFSAGRRADFQVTPLRAPGLPFTLEADAIRNLYTLRLENKTDAPAVYTIAPGAVSGAQAPAASELAFLVAQPRVRVGGLSDVQVPIFVSLPRERWAGPFDLAFTVADSAGGQRRDVRVRFRGP